MCQKCGHKSGLWVLHEMMKKAYTENMKKIVGAVWELPVNSTANPAQFECKWAELAVLFSK